MSRGAVDLVMERLVVEGLELTFEQGQELRRLIEEELRPLLAGGGPPALPPGGIAEVGSLSISGGPDLRSLARVLAREVVARAVHAGGGHV